MTTFEFDAEMARCVNVWGLKSFPEERRKLLFMRYKDLAIHEFKNVVSDLITSCRYAPMAEDWDKMVSMQRSMTRQRQRHQEQKTAEDFWRSTFHADEVKWIVDKIKLRLAGKIEDKEWEDVKQTVANAENTARQNRS